MEMNMARIYDLSGTWKFTLDPMGDGLSRHCLTDFFTDTIELPSTTAIQKKGEENFKKETAHLTEQYPYIGNAWFQKEVSIDPDDVGKPIYLILERTRLTSVWINGNYVSSLDSLCTPHEYDICDFVDSPQITITILVNNKEYKTKGGHLTSPDTQTNWNGITGMLALCVKDNLYVQTINTYPNTDTPSVLLKSTIINKTSTQQTITLCYYGDSVSLHNIERDALSMKYQNIVLQPGYNEIEYVYDIDNNIAFWSEYTPYFYHIYIGINFIDRDHDMHAVFGLRSFTTDDHHFYINNEKTFLRGKHDGLIFPLTGAAPTTIDEWIHVLQIAKSYGINHYRFHTCCPPEAAFYAADLLGIYMQPELPFWGTITTKDDAGHNEEELQYLIKEGERILHAFGNHPSFVMMSLGNELWGSKETLSQILRHYKSLDNRHLYTQGCNNFQWVPIILEEDDFFVGVRFSIERRIRGSYAACDIPFGFVQAEAPNTYYNYDDFIVPSTTSLDEGMIGEIDIQYGTGTKRVTAEKSVEFIPNKPVISHEIGQYTFYPNFHEIDKYVGVLKARNFEVFRERLQKAGMLDLADKFFYSTGKLAIQCYKLELEAAHRAKYLAGYQILDLQDFSGQGTALVGVLDAFMESKGLITPHQWQSFCSDVVIMAKLKRFIYTESEDFTFELILSDYLPLEPTTHEFNISLLLEDNTTIASKTLITELKRGVNSLGEFSFTMPDTDQALKVILKLESILNTSFHTQRTIENQYELWIYPKHEDIVKHKMRDLLCKKVDPTKIQKNEHTLYITHSYLDAMSLLEKKQRVLFIPEHLKKSLDGFYCTDFWCYPMFRSISESVNKDIPIGTMGLYIDTCHPALRNFNSESYSTPQWYEIITASQLAILDGLSQELHPIVQMIDNFERNHKLSLLFEANVMEGKLLVLTSQLQDILHHPEAMQFAISIVNYGLSDDFKPAVTVSHVDLSAIFE